MNIIIWLVVGGLIGWLASMVMKKNDSQGLIRNMIVGIIGVTVAGWFISPLIGVGTINQDNFSLPALIVSFIGAVVLLGIANLVRRGTTRAQNCAFARAERGVGQGRSAAAPSALT